MKKRILSTMLMAAMLLSMTACGASTDAPDTDDSGAEVTTTAAAEDTEAGGDATEETTTTKAPPVEAANITSFSGLHNGYMAFSTDNDKSYLYNIKDNVFTEIDSEYCTFQYVDSVYASCITDSVATIVTDPYKSHCIGAVIDLSNGEIILEMNEDSDTFYTNYSRSTGDMLFIKNEESFEGNTFKFGVMDSNGNWKYDFSESEVFLKDVDYHQNFFGENVLMYNKGEKDNYSYYIYSLKDKTKTPFDLPEGNLIGSSYAVGDMLLITPWSNNGLKWYILNEKGEITPLEYNVSGLSDYGILTEEKKILDTETLEVIYDFSEYGEKDSWISSDYIGNVAIASPEERYATRLENPNGDSYIGIYDKSGNELMKPFKIDFYWSASSSFFSGDYFVVDEHAGSALIIANCATGEIKTYEDSTDELGYYISGCDEELGLMVVESKSDGYYYLVDPANPETLINPFEIAE